MAKPYRKQGVQYQEPELRPPAHVLLRNARASKGMSLQEVAEAAGVNIRQYQKFESGERDVRGCSFALGLRLCEALELDPWDFRESQAPRGRSGSDAAGVFELDERGPK